jgi:hypothetical protein
LLGVIIAALVSFVLPPLWRWYVERHLFIRVVIGFYIVVAALFSFPFLPRRFRPRWDPSDGELTHAERRAMGIPEDPVVTPPTPPRRPLQPHGAPRHSRHDPS